MSRKIILIKQELLLLVYELNRSGLLAENEKIRQQAVVIPARSEERFSRNAETDLVCRLLLEKKKQREHHGIVDSVCYLILLIYTFFFFFFNDTATTEIYTLSLHDALPIFNTFGYF